MIIDMRVYQYAPSQFQSFLAQYRDMGFAITSRHLGTTVAILTSHTGVANRTLQMFAYRDADHRDECREKLRSDPEWLAFIKEAGKTIVAQHNTIIRPTRFSGLSSYDQLTDRAWLASEHARPMIFEMRAYTAQAGKLSEALGLLETEGCPLTHEYVERPVAYFTTETGPSNRVLMLWGYRNDGERDRRRDRMRDDTRFRALGARFNPLFAYQEGELWQATPYSPLR
jgi:hypothetical protein